MGYSVQHFLSSAACRKHINSGVEINCNKAVAKEGEKEGREIRGEMERETERGGS